MASGESVAAVESESLGMTLDVVPLLTTIVVADDEVEAESACATVEVMPSLTTIVVTGDAATVEEGEVRVAKVSVRKTEIVELGTVDEMVVVDIEAAKEVSAGELTEAKPVDDDETAMGAPETEENAEAAVAVTMTMDVRVVTGLTATGVGVGSAECLRAETILLHCSGLMPPSEMMMLWISSGT